MTDLKQEISTIFYVDCITIDLLKSVRCNKNFISKLIDFIFYLIISKYDYIYIFFKWRNLTTLEIRY